jgi:hypothetical protein
LEDKDVTVEDVRQHIETDLVDDALQRLLDAADEDLGSETSVVEYSTGLGRLLIFLRRPASAISSVVEHAVDGDITLVVPGTSTADMRLFEDRLLERLATGTHPASYWGEKVTITYVPNDLRRRDRALLDLVRLSAERRSVVSERIGDYSMQGLDAEAERKKILAAFYKDWIA